MTRAARLALVACATLAVWSGAVVRGGFALDDAEVLRGNPVVTGAAPWTAAFTRDYWSHLPAGAAGHFRPLATLSLRLDHALWGLAPAGYHATNVLLHLSVVLLAARVARRAGAPAGMGLAVFALHPALADSVAWISGRTSLLSALGGLVGCAVASAPAGGRVRAFAGGALAACLGAAGKEDGVVLGALAAACAARGGRRQALAATAGAAAGALLWWWIRTRALGGATLAAPSAPLAGAPLHERLAFGGAALARLAAVAACPLDVPPTLGRAALAPQAGIVALLAWATWATALAGGATACVRRGSTAGAGLALAALACVPWSQLVPIGELWAPRFLYLPLLLAAPALDRAARAVPARARAALAVPLLVLAAVLAWRAVEPYRGRTQYWEARRRAEGDTAAAWNALGNARAEDGDAAGARAAWERAVEVDPGHSRAWNNLGTALLQAGELEPAERFLRRAVREGPHNPVAWANLANLLLRTDRAAEAVRAYARATELSPGAVALWRGAARAALRAGDREGAERALARALELDPADPAARGLAEELAR